MSKNIDAIARTEWRRTVMRGAPLSPLDRAVGFELAEYGNPDGTQAHPGVERLAADLRVTVQAVSTSMKRLREYGFITRTKEGNKRTREADTYALTRPTTEQLAELESKFAAGRRRDTSKATKRSSETRAARKAACTPDEESTTSSRNQSGDTEAPISSVATLDQFRGDAPIGSVVTLDQFRHDVDHQERDQGTHQGIHQGNELAGWP